MAGDEERRRVMGKGERRKMGGGRKEKE